MSRAEISRKYQSIIDFSELENLLTCRLSTIRLACSPGWPSRSALISIPRCFLVDEVLAVGDQAFQLKCMDRIEALKRQGVTICLVSHSMEMILHCL
jgi:ABC-type polysaccharide/polyol phosphate transport system ATPase subunit